MGEPLSTLRALSSSQFWALRFSTYNSSAIKFRCCIFCCSGRVEQMVPSSQPWHYLRVCWKSRILGPTPDLPHRYLHFNKIPKRFVDAFTLRRIFYSSPLLLQQPLKQYQCHKQTDLHIWVNPGLPVSKQPWPLTLDVSAQPHHGFLPQALCLDSHSLGIPFRTREDLGNLWG